MQYIQFNHPSCIRYITFDIDYPGGAYAYDDYNLPSFTLAVINPINAHCHAIYEIPPFFPAHATDKAKKLLKKVVISYRELLCADKAIVNQKQLCKNPLHKYWNLIANNRVRSLSELIESVPADFLNYEKASHKKTYEKGQKTWEQTLVPYSRNCSLFENGRYFAYSIVSDCVDEYDLFHKVESHIRVCNESEIPKHFPIPVVRSEVKSISKSITKWTWINRQMFCTGTKKAFDIGAMGFPKMKGLSKSKYMEEKRERQSASAKRTNELRKTKTITLLRNTYEELSNKFEIVTQKLLSEHSGVSLRQTKNYWKEIRVVQNALIRI